MRRVPDALVCILALLGSTLACAEEPDAGLDAAAPAETAQAPSPDGLVWVPLGGETFQLELALTPRTRFRGLSGRESIARNGGMLFVQTRPRVSGMVMRDCPNDIDVAFLDSQGRVVALHEMKAEPPRRPGESLQDYESRLPVYPSGRPAHFAIETAGGRLAEVGLQVGDRVPLDVEALRARAR